MHLSSALNCAKMVQTRLHDGKYGSARCFDLLAMLHNYQSVETTLPRPERLPPHLLQAQRAVKPDPCAHFLTG
jgi:hypothetical protein